MQWQAKENSQVLFSFKAIQPPCARKQKTGLLSKKKVVKAESGSSLLLDVGQMTKWHRK